MKTFNQFKQYLTEAESFDVTIDEMADMIVRDCGPFLQESDGLRHGPLFRGINNVSDEFIQKSVRKDRKPKDTTEFLHDLFDDFFQEKFGTRFRTVSMFTFSDSTPARHYGTPYMVFPIEDFNYIWSPEVNDLFDKTLKILDKIDLDDPEIVITQLERGVLPDESLEIIKNGFKKELEDASYRGEQLPRAMEANNIEIMIDVNSYYGVLFTEENRKALLKAINQKFRLK